MSGSNLEKLTKSFQNYVDSKSFSSVIFQVLNKEDLYTDTTIKPYISNGLKCFVKNEGIYYKYLDGVWLVDKPWVKSETEPEDKTVMWFPKSRFVDIKNTVSIDSLMQTVQALVSKIEAVSAKNEELEARVKYLEEHGSSGGGGGGGTTNPDVDVSNALLLDDGNALLLDDGSMLLLNINNSASDTNISNALLLDKNEPLLLHDDSILLVK